MTAHRLVLIPAQVALNLLVAAVIRVPGGRAPIVAGAIRCGADAQLGGIPGGLPDIKFRIPSSHRIAQIVRRHRRARAHRIDPDPARRRGRLATAGFRPGRVVLHVGRRAVVFENRHVVGRRGGQSRQREARARPVVADLVAVGLVGRAREARVYARRRRSVRRRPARGPARLHHHDAPLAVAARPVHHHRCRPHRGERPHRPVRRRRRRHERLRPARRGRTRQRARCERQCGISDGADADRVAKVRRRRDVRRDEKVPRAARIDRLAQPRERLRPGRRGAGDRFDVGIAAGVQGRIGGIPQLQVRQVVRVVRPRRRKRHRVQFRIGHRHRRAELDQHVRHRPRRHGRRPHRPVVRNRDRGSGCGCIRHFDQIHEPALARREFNLHVFGRRVVHGHAVLGVGVRGAAAAPDRRAPRRAVGGNVDREAHGAVGSRPAPVPETHRADAARVRRTDDVAGAGGGGKPNGRRAFILGGGVAKNTIKRPTVDGVSPIASTPACAIESLRQGRLGHAGADAENRREPNPNQQRGQSLHCRISPQRGQSYEMMFWAIGGRRYARTRARSNGRGLAASREYVEKSHGVIPPSSVACGIEIENSWGQWSLVVRR